MTPMKYADGTIDNIVPLKKKLVSTVGRGQNKYEVLFIGKEDGLPALLKREIIVSESAGGRVEKVTWIGGDKKRYPVSEMGAGVSYRPPASESSLNALKEICARAQSELRETTSHSGDTRSSRGVK